MSKKQISQQAELPEHEQQDSSHSHIPGCGFTLNAQRAFLQAGGAHLENDPEIEFASTR